jgi:PAS domain S-box-containing protein
MPRVVIEHINISERKRAEDALIESESRFRLMADGCPSMIWAVNAKGETQFVNRAYREFFGETYKRVVDGDWWLVIHPEDALEFVPAFERAVREQKPFSHEVRLKRADGEWRWAASYGEPRFSPSGEYLGLVGLCPDITTRKEAEQALQRSEEKFRQLAENIREVFWVQSLTPGEESYVSPAYESMWGRSCESFYRDPRSWAEAIHPDDRERAVAAFADDVRAESVETEYRIRTPRGEEKWIRDRAFPVYNESGRRIRMVGVAEEITHHKRYEAELVRAREGADAANQAKSRFLANMSHEIRTPMNGVIGMLQLLQGTDLTEEQRRFADVAQSSGRTLLALVDDILDLSKIEARKITIENRRFNLRELVEGVVQLLSVQASEKGQYVRWCVAPEIPDYVRGDAHRLRQILNNLMSNAIKFTGRGTIDLSAELVSIDDVKTTLRFEVRDTGIGLSEGQIATLFSPFVQADTSTTRRYGGTGLGLAICKQLAEMMGGQIGVKSREREGSTFWFTAVLGRIALEEQVASVEDERLLGSLLLAVPEAHVGTGHLGHGERILVAEDNLTNVEVIVALLQKLGYQVDAVGNGADAVVAVGCGKYDLVLMDCEMPMMDGYEATARIRASTRPDVPIVALTADAMPADRERCLAAGMNDYLAKPVELARLAAVLIRWVTGERERADSRKTNSRAEADSAVPNAKEAVLQREVFDEVALLRRLMGDRELAGTVLKGFLGDLPAQLVRLRARIDGGDETGARLLVHTLKGSSATVGAAALHAVAMRMEAEDAEPWLSHCQNLLTCVEQEVVRFQGSVKNRGWV